jgi:hypothetical protein
MLRVDMCEDSSADLKLCPLCNAPWSVTKFYYGTTAISTFQPTSHSAPIVSVKHQARCTSTTSTATSSSSEQGSSSDIRVASADMVTALCVIGENMRNTLRISAPKASAQKQRHAKSMSSMSRGRLAHTSYTPPTDCINTRSGFYACQSACPHDFTTAIVAVNRDIRNVSWVSRFPRPLFLLCFSLSYLSSIFDYVCAAARSFSFQSPAYCVWV